MRDSIEVPTKSVSLTRWALLPASLLSASLLSAACWQESRELPEPAKVPVRSEMLASGPFRPSLVLLGRVEPAARIELRSPTAGHVHYPRRFRNGLRTGEQVDRGELLFEIENEPARLRLAEAELTAQLAQAELARARQGVEGGFLPAAQLKQREIDAELAKERLASAKTQARRLSYRAPAAGVLLVERALAPGSEIPAADMLIAELAGEGLPRVEAWAAAADRERLRAGLTVECLSPGGDKVVGRGTVAEVARQVDRSGTLRVVVAVDEEAGMPLPGEGIELRLLLDVKPDAVTVPREALLVDGGVSSVFLLEPAGAEYRARRRLVVPGTWSDGRVEILDGVTAGERVAVGGAELLADGLPAVEAETPEADPPAGEGG